MSLLSRAWKSLRSSPKPSPAPQPPVATEYETRLATEQAIYESCTNVHDLPAIFHYWSDRYVRPKLEAFGFSNPYDFFRVQVEEKCRQSPDRVQIVSLGSGNGDTEVNLASILRDRSISNFEIECLDSGVEAFAFTFG